MMNVPENAAALLLHLIHVDKQRGAVNYHVLVGNSRAYKPQKVKAQECTLTKNIARVILTPKFVRCPWEGAQYFYLTPVSRL
jgi:hypothetical protein